MPGMSDTNGDTVVMVKLTLPYVFCWDEDGQAACASTVALPDLTDPATLGCLLAIVREAWECPTAGRPEPGIPWLGVARVGDLFEVAVGTVTLAVERTEAAALVAALEAAP